MTAALIPGRWFDGASSRSRPVLVALQAGTRGPVLTLHPAGFEGGSLLSLQHDQVDWPPTWRPGGVAAAPVVDLGDHGSLEISDGATWQAALEAAGHRRTLADRMQSRWPTFVVVLVIAAAALAVFYRWGTPWIATQLTHQVPLAWEVSIAGEALQDLDGHMFKPSELPAARQAQLRSGFDALTQHLGPELQRYPGYHPRLALQFRTGIAPNAIALPGGTIVLTDSLVRTADQGGLGDEALMGVLAHEIGHVVHRHGTRMVVEQAVLNVGLGLAMGDLSGLLSFASSLVVGAAYQRSHERDADCFALALMVRAQKPTGPMAELLLKLDPSSASAGPTPTRSDQVLGLISTHPDTAQRARLMQQGATPGCREAQGLK